MNASQTERRTMNIDEAAAVLGISRSSAYELARKDQLPGAIRLGGRIVVSRRALERVVDGDDGGQEPAP